MQESQRSLAHGRERWLLLADVHANDEALTAVLADASDRGGWDRVLMAGDWVGYGPAPNEVVRRLRSLDPIAIRGDMDELVLGLAPPDDDGESIDPAKRRAVEWTAGALSQESREILGSLPRSRCLEVAGLRASLVHGSPDSFVEHLDPDTPEARLRDLAAIAAVELVVCGHSHLPMDRGAGRTRFVNPGSVGRAADGNPRAAYALLVAGPDGTITVDLRRVAYDVEAVSREVLAAGMDEAVARMFREGRGLRTKARGQDAS